MSGRRLSFAVLSLAFFGIVSVLSMLPAGSAQAQGAWGASGPTSGGSGSGYWTSNGFGWKLFNVSGNGPGGGFQTTNWSTVKAACEANGDNRVWIHVVRNSGGTEKSYTYQGIPSNRNRPSAGLDPYVYNANGVYSYQGAAYQQSVINIVATIETYYKKANPSGSGWGTSIGWFCYRESNFNLTPVINVGRNYGEPGQSIPITANVTNSGTTSSTNATWIAKGIRVPQGQPTPSGSAIFSDASASQIGTGSRQFPRNTTPVTINNQTLSDLPVGDRICYVLSVQPTTQGNAGWAHSAVSCVIIAKSPKIQVIGGDLVVGTGASASNIVTTFGGKNVAGQNRTFGSWGEYAISANGRIIGMASGAGYSGGATGNFCSVSFLTITNAGTGTCSDTTPKGGYTQNTALPNISDRFISNDTTNLGASGVIDVADPGRQGIYTASESVTVTNSGSVPAGKWIVINAPRADVTITDNLTYTNQSLSSISQIPQVIIIADTIAIESDVSRIDAWLVATGDSGTINTCSEISNPAQAGSPLTANRCTVPLTVNGPVVAKRLLLYRTAGAGTGAASGDPAEVFNLRPDAYLWAAYYNSTAGRVPTVNTRELPPRF